MMSETLSLETPAARLSGRHFAISVKLSAEHYTPECGRVERRQNLMAKYWLCNSFRATMPVLITADEDSVSNARASGNSILCRAPFVPKVGARFHVPTAQRTL